MFPWRRKSPENLKSQKIASISNNSAKTFDTGPDIFTPCNVSANSFITKYLMCANDAKESSTEAAFHACAGSMP